ncbi:RNA-directed DNA polymerase, eukaryota [Tanacetum coccineum]
MVGGLQPPPSTFMRDHHKVVPNRAPRGSFPPGCNFSFITLIPKSQEAKMVKDFRPISLIGSMYKIITKVLANRLSLVISEIVSDVLSLVISELVSDVQSAFISNRHILDGPFILNELLSWCKHKKSKALIFKIDFEKAFDSVRWDYLVIGSKDDNSMVGMVSKATDWSGHDNEVMLAAMKSRYDRAEDDKNKSVMLGEERIKERGVGKFVIWNPGWKQPSF